MLRNIQTAVKLFLAKVLLKHSQQNFIRIVDDTSSHCRLI
jgi:hypothetical protein